jgi:hypothetical protein
MLFKMKHTPELFRVFVRLSLVATLLGAGSAPLRAQSTQQLAAARDGRGTPPVLPAALAHAARSRKRIVPVRVTETIDGSRVTVASDAALDDYSAYRAGTRFNVLLPGADAAPQSPGEIAGRGFRAARLERQRDGLLLSFEPDAGVLPRVIRKFNRLEITFTSQQGATQQQQQGAAQQQPAGAAQTTVVAISPATAQGDAETQLRQLLKRVEDLEGQVRELRANASGNDGNRVQTAATTDTTITSPPVAPTTQAEQPAAQEEEAAAREQAAVLGGHEHETGAGGPRLKIQGFADVNLRASSQRGTNNAFSLGQLDLFITSQLSEKFSVVSELIMEAKRDNSFEFEIHRLLLRYALNDYLNLSAGRYHTGIGYYNTAFHHGSYFATAANRPFLFAFEGGGGILPLHNVGVSATGRIPSGKLGLRYIAEVGNGRSARAPFDRTVQTSFDENNGKSYNLGVIARPDALPGLQTGFSFYHDNLTPTDAPNVDQRIMSGHIIYQSPRYEWLNEAVFIRHKPDGAGRGATYTPGFYTQFARRFGKAQPYFRYQYINAPARDPLFFNVGRRGGPSFGLRYDVTTYAAFKAQYDRTERRGLTALDELIMQLAFTF